MATYEQVMDALRQADAAGNTEDAQRLAAIAISLRPDDRASAIPVGDYRIEALRKGPASTAGMIAGLGALAAEGPGGRGLPELFSALAQDQVVSQWKSGVRPTPQLTRIANTTLPMPGGRTPGQVFTEAQQPTQRAIMQALGGTGAEPRTGGEKILASGLQAVTDPLSYAFPPLAGVKRLGMLGQVVARPTEQVVVGSGAEAGGIVGEAFGKEVGAPGTGRVIGGLFGGGGAAYVGGSALKLAPVGSKALDLAKNQWAKVRGTDPEDTLLKDVDNRISNIFIAAGAADPNFMKTLTEAASAQKGVSLKAPGAPEVKMPVSALLADNPVINNFIQNLSARDPVFRAQYGDQYEAAKQALTANQIRLFGDPTKVAVTAAGPDLAKVQARRVKSIDEQIADAYRDQTIDPNVFGQRVANLVEKKEKAAYAEVKPLYTEAFDIAKTKNVELPGASVDDIYNFVASERASDIFKTFPSIYNRVQSRFKPTAVEPSAILTAEGKPMTPGGAAFSAATIEDLDSLKREINRQLGKTDVPTEIRLLSELKQRVGGHIDSLDPDFVNAYRNADKAYLQKVGLPFDAATLKLVDRKKFVEQIAPAIIGNKSNVSEFITATGPEGIQLARSAFLDSFTKAALKNDVLDPKSAAKWLKKNEGGVSLVPGLRDELQTATKDVQQLLAERTRLNADFQRVAGEQIIGAQGVKSPQDLVSKMYGDVKFTNKFMQQYGADKDSVNAVRTFMLDDLVNSADPIAALADRNKAAVFNRVFGPTYAQKVQDFVAVSDRMTRDLTQVGFKGETVPKTGFEMMTGLPPEQVLSRIYNPVSGKIYAITSTFSKFWAKKASEATEARLKELLLNPSDAIKVFQAVQPRVAALDPKKIQDALDVGRKYGIQWVKDALSDTATGAARGAVQQMQPEE